MASHAQTEAAGSDGMLLGFARADGGSGSGRVQVVIDYAALAKAYGGGFGSRLELVQVPACALTTPQAAACRTRTPLAFTNRAAADQLVATLSLTGTTGATTNAADGAARPAAAAPMTATEVISGTSGSQGNYAATSLNPSGTWQASGTGAFTYSYPIDVPTAVGGVAPSVAFSYDSQAVDGETSARNSQASWIGDGWDYDPGFIERSYRSCGSLLDSSGNRLLKGSGDECWAGDNATMSFGSHSGTLVPMAKPTLSPSNLVQQWALQGDDGTIVQELSGAANGLYQGIYYRVLSTDGSAAYFGADHAPTGAGPSASLQSADTSTNSAWGVPVLHPVSGDPCYSSSTGTGSKCSSNEGWRWNLDFTVSPTGFVQRYDYSTETNYYDLGGGQVAVANGSGTLTPYTRGGTLTSISYGYTLADEQAGRLPAAQVVFTSKQRCEISSSFDCTQAISTSNATNWPDVPYDLNCPSSDSTTLPPGSTSVPANVCITSSPSFWSSTRLDSVTTKVNVAGQGLTTVDSYQLGQVYSDAGGSVDPVTGTTVDPTDAGELQAVLWLQTITHTGSATDAGGSSPVTVNPITFIGNDTDNRVTGSDPGDPPLYRPRISQIITETGEAIAVTYYNPDCSVTAGTMPTAPDTDTMSCYQVYWTPPGAIKPIADWFNKTRVQTVAVSDLTGASSDQAGVVMQGTTVTSYDGSPTQTSTYAYGPAAWHRDDSVQTDDQYRTWDQFRGYATVTVTTGSAPDPITQTTTTYMQGMDGDYLADGTRRSVKVVDSVGDQVTDSNWLAGTVLETDTYTKAGGSIDAKTVNGPFANAVTQSVAQSAWTDWNTTDDTGTAPTLSTLPNLISYRPTSTESRAYSLLASGSWRENESITGYDSQGRPSTADSIADVGGSAPQETCSTTSYATPPTSNPMMLTYKDQVINVTGACAGSSPTLLSAARTYYGGDGTLTSLGTFGQLDAAGTGEATGTLTATASSAGTVTAWQTTATMTYDGAGRVTQTLDTNGRPTGTSYTPAWSSAGGNTDPTTVVSTNSQGWTTTSKLDPLRGLVTENIDANNRYTDITYDALGRRTAVWLPGRVAVGSSPEAAYPAYPDEKFAYAVDPGAQTTITPNEPLSGAPSSVTTQTLNENDSYGTSVTFYDGMMQERQTQSDTAADDTTGRVLTDTFYDSHGWPVRTYSSYWDSTTAPSTTMAEPDNENQIPSETVTTYDGQGRSFRSTLYSKSTAQWSSSTSYPGADETVSTPPAGGSTTQTFTNALGQTTSTVVENTNAQVTLTGGQIIASGTSLSSDSVRLSMLASGDLVLSSLASGSTLWHSSTSSTGAYAKFGTDGNLYVYSASGTQLWSTGLAATTGSTLKLQNDANLVDYTSAGTAAWASNTYQKASQANATTSYTYTPAGQVSTVKDSAGNTWSYQYNLLGETTSQSDPNVGTTTFNSYDDLGNLLESTDARGDKLGYAYDWDNRPTAEYNLTASGSSESANYELASWSYDTLAKGYPTSTASYVGGAGSTGSTYSEAVTGYNAAYQQLGSSLTIPAADGFAAAGQSTAPTSGSVTYTNTNTYSPNTGELEEVHYDADGGLPDEAVTYGDYLGGMLESTGSTLTYANGTHGSAAYLDVADYTALGQESRSTYGVGGKQLVTDATWDAVTGRELTSDTNTQTSTTNAIDGYAYRYDTVGDLTGVSDTQSSGGSITGTDTQCFTYDSMQRLTQAWSDTQGLTTLSSSLGGGVGGCASSAPETTTVGTTTVGGPAAYWQSYSYDLLGDRTSLVDHDTSGNAVNDTTQNIAYPGSNGTTSASDPNQATSVTTSNPNPSLAGTTTVTPGYTDPTSGADNGNTTKRTVTATGNVLSGVTTTSGGKLCLADPGASTTPGTGVILWGCEAGGQDVTIGSDGTVRIQGLCLDTTGANDATVVLNTCTSGTASQQWKATATTLVNTSSGRCLADPSGNQSPGGAKQIVWTCGSGGQTYTVPTDNTAIPAGQTQTTTYDAEGRTSTVTTGTGTTTATSSYLYDASGSLLEQTSSTGSTPTTRILYLFGGAEQITLNVPNKSWTALRNYNGPDGTTITRTSAGTVAYQVANGQGTAETTIDASSLAVTRRYYDPYGNPRGTQPTTWISTDENRGFLNQPSDPNTGLDLLGARNYDPTEGRFTSPDPIFEAGEPNQMGGYTYAADNPSTGSDPTGLMCTAGVDSPECSSLGIAPRPETPSAPPPTNNSSGSTSASSSCDSACQNGELADWEYQTGCDLSPGACAEMWRESQVVSSNPEETYPLDLVASVSEAAELTAGKIQELNSLLCDIPSGVVLAVCMAEEALQKSSGSIGGFFTSFLKEIGDSLTAGKSVNPTTAAKRTGGGGKSASGGSSCLACGECSFSPTTPVLLANGKTKPIAKLKDGDEVESADPNTGKEEGGRMVQHVWINHDTDLLDVIVSTGHGHTATIHTTANHPFWDDTTHTWVAAGSLKPGHELNSTGAHHSIVVATHATPGAANRWNLTVQQLHTYYVVAGGTPILVHNTDGEGCKVDLGNGTYLHPDGSIRDANGHYAGTTGVQPGANNEETVWDHLQTEGVTVVRQETSVRVPGFKLRKFDGLANIDGLWYGIETKGASAGRNPDQKLFDGWLNTPGNTAVTLNGQYELHGVFDAWVP
ncbi:ricin-type beta-trefoil lectin domain protein [Streptacidiphilus sp. P02-A3a]|uniref:ricin-type beta-trefoil lectin domain protein n=1 Tax=Streptacidiphilus sp. P02-A3a TaxID=2704468 RepID=UPI0015FDE044|nr:ricin-type beta-trefoil lectin domain protein [Streptacidiphilus sp. P02-A3a]QMU70139.1 hypothetical protein GXP74_19795 [Streptacidiphilus sp. P02-A3a]QMU70411.1 hypothetical protein GXP74_21560 [Streptacidiphilus sp. P02-A3a]